MAESISARALVCDADHHVTLAPITLRSPHGTELLARTLRSGLSIGTEGALLRGSLTYEPYPIVTGYQGVAVVEQVGADVEEFAAGDLIYYRDGRGMASINGNPAPTAGVHASMALMDTASGNVHRLPDGVSPDAASQFVTAAVGLHAVDESRLRLGQSVVIVGAGLIGLSVVAHAAARGAEIAIIDPVEPRLVLAKSFGADHRIALPVDQAAAAVLERFPEGPDVVFEATGARACLDPAIRLCRTEGTFVPTSNYGDGPLPYDFLAAHVRRLTMHYPCNDGGPPARRAVLKAMGSGTLPWEQVITDRVSPDAAAALLQTIATGGDLAGTVGLVIEWDEP